MAFWISKLALVTRTRHGQTTLEGFVLDAGSGEPIAEAKVRAWYRQSRGGWTELKAARTDRNGLFGLQPPQRQNVVMLADHAGQQLATAQCYSVYSRDPTPKPYAQADRVTAGTQYTSTEGPPAAPRATPPGALRNHRATPASWATTWPSSSLTSPSSTQQTQPAYACSGRRGFRSLIRFALCQSAIAGATFGSLTARTGCLPCAPVRRICGRPRSDGPAAP